NTSATTPDGQFVVSVAKTGITDIWGNPGIGTSSETWVHAANKLAVSTATGLPSGETSIPSVNITVQFNKPVDGFTFDADDIVLTRNGGSDLLTAAAGATITQTTADTFQITLPYGLVNVDGNYSFTVSATGVGEPITGDLGVGAVTKT